MNAYEKYYMNQVGGGLPVFVGSRIQKGHGLGSLFRGLARVAAPLFVKGAKAVGKQMLQSGFQVMDDVAGGRSFKQSLKQRSRQGAKHLVRKGIRKMQTGKGVSLTQASKLKRTCKVQNKTRGHSRRNTKGGTQRKASRRKATKRKASSTLSHSSKKVKYDDIFYGM